MTDSPYLYEPSQPQQHANSFHAMNTKHEEAAFS